MDSIKISSYNPAWPDMFKQERSRITDCLAEQSVLDISHFGSTAIPGMPAKPIIDILISVSSFDHAKQSFPGLLDTIGYDYWHDNPKTDRLFFVKNMPPRGEARTHHVHVFEHFNVYRDHLAFRDHLRENAEDASQYALLKRKLATQFANDREAYTDAKSEFIQQILTKAAP